VTQSSAALQVLPNGRNTAGSDLQLINCSHPLLRKLFWGLQETTDATRLIQELTCFQVCWRQAGGRVPPTTNPQKPCSGSGDSGQGPLTGRRPCRSSKPRSPFPEHRPIKFCQSRRSSRAVPRRSPAGKSAPAGGLMTATQSCSDAQDSLATVGLASRPAPRQEQRLSANVATAGRGAIARLETARQRAC